MPYYIDKPDNNTYISTTLWFLLIIMNFTIQFNQLALLSTRKVWAMGHRTTKLPLSETLVTKQGLHVLDGACTRDPSQGGNVSNTTQATGLSLMPGLVDR